MVMVAPFVRIRHREYFLWVTVIVRVFLDFLHFGGYMCCSYGLELQSPYY